MQHRLEGRGASAPCSGLGSASTGVHGDSPVCMVSRGLLGHYLLPYPVLGCV